MYNKSEIQHLTEVVDAYAGQKNKELIKDLKNAQQRYKENLSRMDGKNGRKKNEGS